MAGGRIEEEHTYGRVVELDARDSAYSMRALLPGQWPKVTHRNWTIGPVLDQGRTGSCVGQAVKQWLMTTPVPSSLEQRPSALDIYDTARHLDDDPTNDNRDSGTSVRAGFQAIAATGRVRNFVWAWDVDTIARWLLTRGSVVIGVRWFAGMEWPDSEGYIHVEGPYRGGHCTLLYGVDRRNETLWGVNSWGNAWGMNGRFALHFEEMQRLLEMDGEAVTALEQIGKNA